jgi:hypothetical protein
MTMIKYRISFFKTGASNQALKNIASQFCNTFLPSTSTLSINASNQVGLHNNGSQIRSCRSQWPRGLRRRSAAECLLGSWVRIPPGAWMFVSCECLCCQVEVYATGRSLVQRSPTDCDVCLSVIK